MSKSIAAKLQWAFGGVIALILIVLGVGMKSSLDNLRDAQAMSHDHVQAAIQLASAQDALWRLRYGFPQFMVVDADARNKIVSEEPKWRAVIDASLKIYEQGKRTPEEMAALKELRDAYRQYVDARPRWFELYAAGKVAEAAEWRGKTTTPFGAATVNAFSRQIGLQQKIAEEQMDRAEQSAARTKTAMFIAAAVALLIGGAVSFFMARTVTRPVRELERRMGALAAGDADLTVRLDVQSHDEIGAIVTAFNRMMDKFHSLVVRVRTSAGEVASAASGLTAATARIADGARGQNQVAASTAAAIEQLTVSVAQVADNSREATSISEQAAGLSGHGEVLAHEASGEMSRIAESVRESSRLIDALNQRSAEISGIVNVIMDVANQTNLLALNAAIEAARAGEQGRGFSVVADEVRKLAERTGAATTEISTMIEAIQREVANAVTTLETSSGQVSEGVKRAEQVAQQLARINAGAKRAMQQMSDIAAAAKEQGSAASDMARDVERMAQMTEENSAAVQASSASARQLQGLADSLLAEVARFRT